LQEYPCNSKVLFSPRHETRIFPLFKRCTRSREVQLTIPLKQNPTKLIQIRHALSFGSQKLNLHQAGAEFEPKATLAKPGTADLCFITSTPITDVLAELKEQGLEILEEGKVVDRTGAVGKLKSVYTRDPDGNLIEVSNYV